MEITKAEITHKKLLASLISESNKDVAIQFGISFDNNPKHPSFCTPEWISSDFDKGQEYFLLTKNNTTIGCIAFEQPRPNTAYLNRLSVLPDYRHQGAGELLVKYIFQYAKEKNINEISIGIIASHDLLKSWYVKLGFIEKHTKKIEHLPFDVTYMKYELKELK